MRVIRPSSVDEMIAVFLRAELPSPRFDRALENALERAGAHFSLVEAPDLADPEQNVLRRRLLTETRGYGTDDGVFGGLPDDITWERVGLRRDEVAGVRYMDYDYWVELSGGTRSPADSARRIRQGVDVFGVPSAGFLDAATALAAASSIVEPILVTAGDGAPLVVLEGHVRMTVYALQPELVPRELEALLGTSEHMAAWWGY